MWITALLFFIIVFADQLTKYLTEIFLRTGETFEFIPHFVSFTKVYNTGAAFSMLSNATWFLALISLVASCIMGYLCLKNDWKNKKLYSISITLMFAGTFGNLIDRFIATIAPEARKGVVDMIIFKPLDFIWKAISGYSFAIFNVADMALVFGVILLSIYLLFFEGKEKADGENSN